MSGHWNVLVFFSTLFNFVLRKGKVLNYPSASHSHSGQTTFCYITLDSDASESRQGTGMHFAILALTPKHKMGAMMKNSKEHTFFPRRNQEKNDPKKLQVWQIANPYFISRGKNLIRSARKVGSIFFDSSPAHSSTLKFSEKFHGPWKPLSPPKVGTLLL